MKLQIRQHQIDTKKPQDILYLEAETTSDKVLLCQIADKLCDVGIGPLNVDGPFSIEIPILPKYPQFHPKSHTL